MSENSCWICGSEVHARDVFCSNCGAKLTHLAQRKTRRVLLGPKDFSAGGIFMLILGAFLTVFGFLVGIVPVVASGLGALILGVMLVFLPESISVRAGRIAILTSLPPLLEIEALLKDLDVGSRGIYVPVSGFGEVPKVLIPLKESASVTYPPTNLARSNRVFITLGRNPNERGILLYAPGGEIVSALENCLQLDLGTVKLDDLAGRMGFGFDMLGISKRTVAIQVEKTAVRVQMNLVSLADLEQRLRAEAPRLVEQVGSPLTSAVAAAVSKVTGKYVRVNNSTLDRSSLSIILTLSEDVAK